jgi:diacylglycerol kinase (ATP)
VTETAAQLPSTARVAAGGTVLVVNPTKVDDPAGLLERVAKRSAELGLPVPRLVPTTQEDPGEGQARDAAESGAGLVLVAGGDGTVRAAAQGLAHSGVPLGILPQGTGNLLARNLDLPQDEDDALEVALRGADRTLDLGRLDDGTAFAVMAGAGFDALMMREAPEGLKSVIGWPAYLVGGVRGLRHRRVHLSLRLDDAAPREAVVRTVLVGNVGKLQGGLELLPDAEPDDGALDVALVAPRSPKDWVVLVVRGLTRRHRPDHRLELLRAKRVEVRTRRPEARQVDGDLIDDGPGFTAEIDPGAIVVRVPRQDAEHHTPVPSPTRPAADTPAGASADPSEQTHEHRDPRP